MSGLEVYEDDDRRAKSENYTIVDDPFLNPENWFLGHATLLYHHNSCSYIYIYISKTNYKYHFDFLYYYYNIYTFVETSTSIKGLIVFLLTFEKLKIIHN